MREIGTCPVCHRERLRLNIMSGKLIQHSRRKTNRSWSVESSSRRTDRRPIQYEICPGSHRSPVESRSEQ